MSVDDVIERLTSDKEERNKWIGVYIGVLAVVLAICGVGGGNAAKDATRANIEASNTWAFFQAKNIRRNSINLAADELELRLAAQPAMPAAARQAVEAKIKDYRATAQRLTTDPEKKEGLDELFVKGKALEVERDIALRKDPYFDWSQALLQIAIVLASVHLIIDNLWLLGLSAGSGALGMLLMLNGFTLLVPLPFLGCTARGTWPLLPPQLTDLARDAVSPSHASPAAIATATQSGIEDFLVANGSEQLTGIWSAPARE